VKVGLVNSGIFDPMLIPAELSSETVPRNGVVV